MRKLLFGLFIIFIILIILLFKTSLFGFRVYRIVSGSMSPTININDIVIVKKQNKYKIGDIVTYKIDNDFVTHRIISMDNNQVITKGDANNVCDDKIDKDSIIGKVIFKSRIFKFLYYKPYIFILVFIVGLVITILIPDKKRRGI